MPVARISHETALTAEVVNNAIDRSFIGTTTNNNALAGRIGEYGTSTNAYPGITLTTATNTDIAAVTLAAGDYDVWGVVGFLPEAATTITNMSCWINTASGPSGLDSGWQVNDSFVYAAGDFSGGNGKTMTTPVARILLAGSTSVKLGAVGIFAVSNLQAYGTIQWRRRR